MKNRIGYYIKEGFTSIFSHGFMSFASICVIVACLVIMGSFSLLALNVDAIINKFEDENVVLAYVEETYSENQARELEEHISALSNVASVEFISREEAMASFTSDYEDQSMFEDIDSSILRDRYAIYLVDIELIEQTQQQIAGVEGIAEVNIHLGIAQGFVTLRNIVTVVSVVLVAILLIVSLFIMSNTIKLTTFDRREEIAIMRMVGAKSSFIRWPFVLQGFILGIVGAGLAFLVQWGIYALVLNLISDRATMSFLQMIPFAEVAAPLGIVFAGLGFIVGVGGSAVAIRNYLKV